MAVCGSLAAISHAETPRGEQPAPPPPAAEISKTDRQYETKILWDFENCIEDRFMRRVSTYVYNGNVYTWVLLPGYKTMIVKVPLDGGEAQMCPLMPGHVTGSDPHRYYSIAADAQGYIHVSGDMHSSPIVKHWISKKPEDISEFIPATSKDGDKGPIGFTVTYPHFIRSPDGDLYFMIRESGHKWGLCLSKLDVKTQTWNAIGADIPKADGGKSGIPFIVWEDNGEGGNHNYMQPHGSIHWDKNKRMHVAFAVLNENTPSSQGRHTLSDVLYAYSDDGGKTFHRGDGSTIELPMRADAGPHQGDVVFSEHEGPPPWLNCSVHITVDDRNRPVISFSSHKTGRHSMVLADGKWISNAKSVNSPKSDATAKPNDDEEDEESELADVSKLHLPYEPFHLSGEYLHETGNALYFVFPEKDRFHGYKPKLHHLMLVLSKPGAK